MALMLGCPKIKNIHTYNMENSVSKQQTIRLKMKIKIIWKTQWLICEYIISEIIHEKHAKELPHSDFIFKTTRTFELFFGYLPISQLCCTQIVDSVWDQHPVFMPAEPAGLNMISACSCARLSEDQAIDMLVWALCFHHGMLGRHWWSDKCSGHHVFKLLRGCKFQESQSTPIFLFFKWNGHSKISSLALFRFPGCSESWPAIVSISGSFMAFLPSRRLFVGWVLGWRFHPTEALTFSQTGGQWWMEKTTKKGKHLHNLARIWTIQSLRSKVSKHAQWMQDGQAFKCLTCYVRFSSCWHLTGKRDGAIADRCHLQLAKALWRFSEGLSTGFQRFWLEWLSLLLRFYAWYQLWTRLDLA